ncbi:MAG: TonB family protein [Terriglobia bacterium]
MATATQVELLPQIGDEHGRSRRREATMVSLILHLGFVVLLLTNPKVLQFLGPKPLPPEVAAALARQRLTLLYLPSDVLEIPESKQEELTEEERKRAVIRTPFTVDPRELRRILAPVAPAEPGLGPELPAAGSPESSGQAGDAEEAESEAARAASGEESPEEQETQLARLEDVPEPNQAPKLELPLGTAGRAIEESLRAGAARQGQSPRAPGLGLPGNLNLNTPYPMILSDTRGVDFGPYLTRLLYNVRQNWYAVMPEAARLGRKGRVVIVFEILKDGAVPLGQPMLVRPAGFLPFDRAAMGSIRGAQPFSPLPEQFTGEHIVLQFTFLYNLPLDYNEP